MRGTGGWAIALLVLGTSASAHAQGEPAAEQSGATVAAQPGADAETGSETQPGSERIATPPSPSRSVPPIMIVTLPTGRVPPESVDATRDAIVAQVTPMAGGRPVLPLLAPEVQSALAACADAPCLGARIADAGAIGAIVARISRRAARGPIELRIAMIDPVSGAPRVPEILHTIPEGASVAETIAPLIEQLRPAMYAAPPPPPRILVTVNVDGAAVRIDDQLVGESPVAPLEVEPGRHVIVVQRDGYLMMRREVEVDLGDSERVDVTLQSMESAGIDPRTVAETSESGGAAERGPEWYEHWGFWTGVGAGVLVIVGVGIAVGVATSDQGPPPDPQGIPLPMIR
jgi:hypothetical protein